MKSNTLQRLRPLMKFYGDRHLICITARANEHKEELQSYYKLTEEDLEEITKNWSAELLIPADPVEIADPELDSSEVAHKENDTSGIGRRKKSKT